MLKRYADQILSLYNYIDGIMVTDKDGYVEYYLTYRPDIIAFDEKDVLGKHVLDIYPHLTAETSSIMRVLNNGEPIFNEKQHLISYNGQRLNMINSTMPLMENDKIIGAIDVSRYVDPAYMRQNIHLSLKKVKEPKELYTVDDIISNSHSMELMKDRIPLIANTDSSVMIYGETGTGKELVAQSIHTSSKRRKKKFISQNCAAIPGNLLEGLLFGTTKGSYTGAENKPGLFEIANGGTLFLDEINSMEIGVQSKILKAIEEKKITRLGSYEPIHTDIKIISAVNENPLKCVENGKLREDLFYRLSVVQINVPPLRDRKDDILYLTSDFIKKYNKQMNKDIMGIDVEVENIFKNYRWPGNVRELKNVIEGAFNMAPSRFIQKKDLPEYLYRNSIGETMINEEISEPVLLEGGINLEEAMASYEKNLIKQALKQSNTLVSAARLLGISKQSLAYKMTKHNISK